MKDSEEVFNKSRMVQELEIWFMAARPRTFTVILIPILAGTVLSPFSSIDWAMMFYTIISAFFVLVGINLSNDALDYKKGADNQFRIGFKRVTQNHLFTYRKVLTGAFICFGLALICGIPLIIQGGWPLLLVLLSSIVFGYLYTGGPFPLAYHGLGEIFVLIFFGWMITLTAFYLQTGFVDYPPLLAGTQIGLLASAMIAVNNQRDIVADSYVNKKTLVVRFGKTFGRVVITINSILPFILGLLWMYWGHFFAAFLPMLLLPVVYQNLKSIWTLDSSPLYNQFFTKCALIHLAFGLVLVIGLMF